jgi:hypothetical protein
MARVALLAALVAAFVAVSLSAVETSSGRTYRETCADSVYQAPRDHPPSTGSALHLGPVAFNLLAPVGENVNPPTKTFRFLEVVTFFNVYPSAGSGATVTVSSRSMGVALIYGGLVTKPPAFWRQLHTAHATLADGPRSVRFPVCRDATTGKRLVTQYGLSIVLSRPGCFTIQVQPLGTKRRYRATVRVLVPRCAAGRTIGSA